MLTLQLPTWQQSLSVYFSARGESFSSAIYSSLTSTQQGDFSLIWNKIFLNARILVQDLLGLKWTNPLLNPPIAISFWDIQHLLYPRWLAPIFIIGIASFPKKYLWHITFLFLGIIPGLMSATGFPNPARNLLLIIPLYFFIVSGIFFICEKLIKKSKEHWKYHCCLFLTISIAVYQWQHFFTHQPIIERFDTTAANAFAVVESFWKKNPQGNVLFHEFAPFNRYSYSVVRMLGGSKWQERYDNGQILYLRESNLDKILSMINQGKFQVVISSFPEEILLKIPQLASFPYQQIDNEIRQYFLINNRN